MTEIITMKKKLLKTVYISQNGTVIVLFAVILAWHGELFCLSDGTSVSSRVPPNLLGPYLTMLER